MSKKIQDFTHIKLGKRVDLGDVFFRSSWEANYARYLNYLIEVEGRTFTWEFESDEFWFEGIKRGTRSYLPDFKIQEAINGLEQVYPFYIEIKGWMDKKSKTKLKRMRIYHPDVKIYIVGIKEYRVIEKVYSEKIKHWEYRKSDKKPLVLLEIVSKVDDIRNGH